MEEDAVGVVVKVEEEEEEEKQESNEEVQTTGPTGMNDLHVLKLSDPQTEVVWDLQMGI